MPARRSRHPPGWSLRGKRFKSEARHIEKVHEPFDGTARQPAGFSKVIAGRIACVSTKDVASMWAYQTGIRQLRGADHHTQHVTGVQRKRCRKIVPSAGSNNGADRQTGQR
jgi:hypothetical protein